jgi:hypothetical protein
MTADALRTAHQTRPFRPFIIFMGDGTQHRVTHPELLSMSQNGRIAIVHGAGETFSVLDLLLMTEIRIASDAATTNSAS